MIRIAVLTIAMICGLTLARADDSNLALRRSVEEAMHRANTYYQNSFPIGNAAWNRGAYHVGNFRSWEYLGVRRDLDYAIAWSAANNWTRGPEGPAHADAHCCGQVYIDLYRADRQPVRIANIKSTMDALLGISAATDDWWWIDAFFMAAPTFAKLGATYNNTAYFSQLETMYLDMKNTRQLFDPAHGLWYRDAAAKGRTGANTPEFWGRGNGWVIAACARLLEELPAGDPRRTEFATMLQTMAAALLPWQGTDGFWRSNIKLPGHFPNPETSCTAFFTYAIAYGINAGLLDAATYKPVVMNAWNGMTTTALQPSGKLGYVQAVGFDPKAANYDGDQDYGYGAFLLAGVEVLRILGGPGPVAAFAGPNQIRIDSDGDYAEVCRLDGSGSLIRDGSTASFTWWRGNIFLGEGTQLDVTLPIGKHDITLKVQHGTGDPYIASTTVQVLPPSSLMPDVKASGFQQGNPPANVIDGNLSTRWSQEGLNQWIQLDLTTSITLDRVQLAFYQGSSRFSKFDLAVSTDGITWEQVFSGQSSGGTDGLETFTFPARSIRHVRYNGRGNSQSNWNSVTEFKLPIEEAPDAADNDGNGLPDSWEIHHFGSIGQDAAMRVHYLAGNDPKAPGAIPALQIQSPAITGNLRLVLMPVPLSVPDTLGRSENSASSAAPTWPRIHGCRSLAMKSSRATT